MVPQPPLGGPPPLPPRHAHAGTHRRKVRHLLQLRIRRQLHSKWLVSVQFFNSQSLMFRVNAQ